MFGVFVDLSLINGYIDQLIIDRDSSYSAVY